MTKYHMWQQGLPFFLLLAYIYPCYNYMYKKKKELKNKKNKEKTTQIRTCETSCYEDIITKIKM